MNCFWVGISGHHEETSEIVNVGIDRVLVFVQKAELEIHFQRCGGLRTVFTRMSFNLVRDTELT
jgi:hypothetical protein